MKKNKRPLMIFLGGILVFVFGLGNITTPLWAKTGKASPKARLIQIEDQVFPDRLRVILKTSQPVVHRSFTMTDPHRLVVDLTSCVLIKDKSFKINDLFIEGLRVIQFNPKTVRLVFTVSQHPTVHIASKGGKPFQLFVDFSKIKPQLSQPIPQQVEKVEKEILPEVTIEEFKKEKALQDSRLNEEKSLAKKPLLDFDFYMENLHNVFRFIGEIGGVNIIVGDEVKDKKLTLSLKKVTWDEAMNSIVEGNNLKKLKRGEKTFLITTRENYKKILDDENKLRQEAIKTEQEELKAEEQRQKVGKVLWSTRQFQVKNVDVKLVEDLIQGSIEKEKKISVDKQLGSDKVTTETTRTLGTNVNIISVPHTNTLIAKGTERDLDYIENLVKLIDQPISQVMIEARIVEADANFTRDMGIQWGGSSSFANASGPFAGTVQGGAGTSGTGNNYAINLPLNSSSTAFGGLGFSFAAANLNIDVRIQAMEQQGRGKTISSPKVLTKDNTEANIKQGTSIPVTTQTVVSGTPVYSTTYIDAILELKVTPHISSNNNIRIKIDIVKKDPDFTNKDIIGNPYINMKEASTEMMVKDGDTVVIGGIIFKKETLQDNKVPGLGDIPLLGWLFKTRYRTTADTELLIFLTPKIVKPSLSERFRNDS
ncbi:MAG: type IV pilus secretin PilQ [Thermodesulfobacteriota bacterium]|jgi:type IV pilus secretin PilQ/predicted competence protein